jgi:cardiolipin synthase A/B
MLVALAACATPPDIDQVRADAGPDGTAPRLVAARGPLTAQQSKAILERLRAENPSSDLLQRHLAFEEAITTNPLSTGNKIALLRDGPRMLQAALRAIRNARDHVNLEYYIFEDFEQDGVSLIDLLVQKQRAGVQINVIYDGHGSRTTPGEVFDRLKEAGATLLQYHPLNPLAANKTGYAPNDRDHRKILVADGTVAITGGANLSKVYASGSSSRSGANAADKEKDRDKPKDEWRDTSILIEGPAVAELQKLFLEHWQHESGETLPERRYFPPLKNAGDETIRVIGSTPEDKVPQFYVTLLSAIRNAEKQVWLTASYFAPPDQALDTLLDAARRGVDVRILLQGKTDSDMVHDAGRAYYSELLEHGIKLYEMDNAILHSKTAVIDGVWSVVGSSNFDARSVVFNDEVDTVILGHDTAAQLQAAFQQDIGRSKEIEWEAWRNRPFTQRVKQFFSRLWAHWL